MDEDSVRAELIPPHSQRHYLCLPKIALARINEFRMELVIHRDRKRFEGLIHRAAAFLCFFPCQTRSRIGVPYFKVPVSDFFERAFEFVDVVGPKFELRLQHFLVANGRFQKLYGLLKITGVVGVYPFVHLVAAGSKDE